MGAGELTATTRGRILWILGPLALLASIAVSIVIGAATISVGDVYGVVVEHLGGPASELSAVRSNIVWELRLPRALMAVVCGAGLALCGVIMQSLLRNPLADPYVLGVSSGASTGAVIIVVLGIGGGAISLSTGAFAGAMVSFALVMLLAWGAGGGTSRIVLAGVAGTQLFSSLTSFIVISSADAERTRGVLFWLLGSLSGVDWTDVIICGVVVIGGLGVCLWQAKALDAFTFGNSAAASLGISVAWVRAGLLVLVALVTAALVSAVGAIGFVGLVLPHATRLIVGMGHRQLIPAVALTGSIFMIWVDTVARTVFAPQEVPVGVVTALIGVPCSPRCCSGCGGRHEYRSRHEGTRMTLRAKNLSWNRGGTLVLDDVSLDPMPGETIGILGPNGSGKSSLLRALAGIARPQQGTVTLDGTGIGSLRRRDVARRVAMVSQHATTETDIAVIDVVRLGRIPHASSFGGRSVDEDRVVEAALERTGLADKATRSWRTLSGGEQQRAQIARALAQEPQELLLDEPTNHLDIHHQFELLSFVAALPVTSYLAIHDLNHAAMFCDRVLVLNRGAVVDVGVPQDVLTAERISEVYRVRVEILTGPGGRRTIVFLPPG